MQDLRLAIGGVSDFPQRLPLDIHIDVSGDMADTDTRLTTAIDAALDSVDFVEICTPVPVIGAGLPLNLPAVPSMMLYAK